jgi:hypothetical protein
MGTGIFLLEAARTVPRQQRAAFAERCLFGLDLDPSAVELAIRSLVSETGARPEILASHLRVGDALAEDLPAGSFDVVVGNPPWGATYDAAEWSALRRRFPASTRRSPDSFKLFLDLTSRCTRGSLGMVVPQAVLGQAQHADVRALLLERLAPYAAEYLGDRLFPGATAPACALIFGARPGPPEIAVGATGRLPAGRWTAERFPLVPDAHLALLARLRRTHASLGDLGAAFQVRDVGINYNRSATARRIFYQGVRQDSLDRPRYRGRDFAAYTEVRPGGWLRHDARSLLAPGESLTMNERIYVLPEKIVFRQTADRIIATLDRSRAAMGRSVIAVTSEGDASLRALLVYLNSRLVTVLYRALAGEEGRVLPQVKVGSVLALPVPELRTERATLERLATALLACEGRDAGLLKGADRVVERMCGLTAAETALLAAHTL